MPYIRGRKTYHQPGRECRLNKYGFKVLIAEKPKAAEKIARALGNSVKCRMKGVPYWIVRRNGDRLVIVSSAGHMYGLNTSHRGFPVYEYVWQPLWRYEKGSKHLRKFYELLSYILPKASFYINACDYDIEGSVIGFMIIEDLGDPHRFKRMVFSSLSPIELRKAYENLRDPDIEMVEAGKARHEMDWLWGINVSRALMTAVKVATGKRVVLSAGRVQTPTLAEAVRRWVDSKLAVPLPYFPITIILREGNTEFTASPLNWRPKTKIAAQAIVSELKRSGYLKVTKIERKNVNIRPPPAFNLGDLQAEAARLFRFSPMKTQKLAEDLYLEALISYPRTNSQKLPLTIDYLKIIRNLGEQNAYSDLVSSLLKEVTGPPRPVQGRKEDPAHPAIHPTGLKPRRLDKEHWAIYDLIVRRFLAAFSKPAVISRTNVILEDYRSRKYEAKGVMIIREGWYKYYPFLKPRELRIPLLSEGKRVKIVKAGYSTKWNVLRPHLSKTELLKWMETVGIGTEATRARIIEILYRRGYLESRGGKTQVTDLGLMVSEIVSELFPDLSKTELTRRFEEYIAAIREGKMTRKTVVRETIRELDRLLSAYKEKLPHVGRRLAIALGTVKPRITCIICGREAVTEDPLPLCKYHREALVKIRRALPEISEALNVTRGEALRLIASRRGEAGKWIIEVAKLLVERSIL